MLEQGLMIAATGISVVFIFLLLMLIVMMLNAGFVKFLNTVVPEPAEETAPGSAQDNELEIVAVALAAVHAKK